MASLSGTADACATVMAENENAIIAFKGTALMASDVWMNHWLYIGLSVCEAVVNVRMTYIVLEMGTWMLGKQINLDNFIFMCSALTKITWIMCMVHTLIRLASKMVIRALKTFHLIRAPLRDKLEWYVDSMALFLSYKIYNLLLCVILAACLKFHGGTTFMRPDVIYKQGVFGGLPVIAQFWGNEIICDLTVLLSMLTACGMLIGLGMLTTRYRLVANNGVIQLLQRRYVFVGWDVLTACAVLGIDPYEGDLGDPVVTTKCSLGSLLQVLYYSGPSGLVHLAGDYLFVDGGFTKDPINFRFPVKRAIRMGVCTTTTATSHKKEAVSRETDDLTASHQVSHRYAPRLSTSRQQVAPVVKQSLFDRQLKIASEGYIGKLLLIDENEPGSLSKNPDTGIREFVVRDALSFISIMDIKPLLGDDKKLHII